MQYLGKEYRLHEVSLEVWKEQGIIFAEHQHQDGGMRAAIGLALDQETKYVRRWLFEKAAARVTRTYLAIFALGIAAIRAENPEVAPISGEDFQCLWSGLEHIPKTKSYAKLQPAADGELAVIRQLNWGYVDGIRQMGRASVNPGDKLALDIAAIHAHGLMHFASQRANTG